MKLTIAVSLLAGTSLALAQAPAWVAKSNENAKVLISLETKYSPEGASSEGLPGFDELISQPTEETAALSKADLQKARVLLQGRLSVEKDPLVKQDLEILLTAADRDIHATEVREKTFLTYINVGRLIFSGEKTLLDDQVNPERRPAAVVRLRKYTGLEPGFTPLTKIAEDRYLAKAKNPALLGPSKESVEKDL
ncbi:MAG TPA: hypothetical protein VNH18_02510 [Bryobacteraceae bacterium]|nr:hypothetical protein [Bryobacteraceae bacterium]